MDNTWRCGSVLLSVDDDKWKLLIVGAAVCGVFVLTRVVHTYVEQPLLLCGNYLWVLL